MGEEEEETSRRGEVKGGGTVARQVEEGEEGIRGESKGRGGEVDPNAEDEEGRRGVRGKVARFVGGKEGVRG